MSEINRLPASLLREAFAGEGAVGGECVVPGGAGFMKRPDRFPQRLHGLSTWSAYELHPTCDTIKPVRSGLVGG